eukprot:3807336-Rhodomonas_salina.2
MSSTDKTDAVIGLRACYAMSDTDLAFAATSEKGSDPGTTQPLATSLRACYAMSGTDLGYYTPFLRALRYWPRLSNTAICYAVFCPEWGYVVRGLLKNGTCVRGLNESSDSSSSDDEEEAVDADKAGTPPYLPTQILPRFLQESYPVLTSRRLVLHPISLCDSYLFPDATLTCVPTGLLSICLRSTYGTPVLTLRRLATRFLPIFLWNSCAVSGTDIAWAGTTPYLCMLCLRNVRYQASVRSSCLHSSYALPGGGRSAVGYRGRNFAVLLKRMILCRAVRWLIGQQIDEGSTALAYAAMNFVALSASCVLCNVRYSARVASYAVCAVLT